MNVVFCWEKTFCIGVPEFNHDLIDQFTVFKHYTRNLSEREDEYHQRFYGFCLIQPRNCSARGLPASAGLPLWFGGPRAGDVQYRTLDSNGKRGSLGPPHEINVNAGQRWVRYRRKGPKEYHEMATWEDFGTRHGSWAKVWWAERL